MSTPQPERPEHRGPDRAESHDTRPLPPTGRRPGQDRPDEQIDPRTDSRVRRGDVVAHERARFGGVKVGSAFFGWLAATGMTVILTALLAGAGTAVGVATGTDLGTAAGTADPATVGVVGIVALAVIVFVAYYCGGYVAGRMARFNGLTQGAAVWVWAIAVAVLVAVISAVAGGGWDVLSRLNTLPRIPVGQGELTTAGITVLVIGALASLGGALLGGLAGMRFHRRVDRAGLGD